ncbi:hypothetical protein MXD62_03410 [Frankia sp. Mgl5]|nr:hypothetical protein [Frankia sp. Mgl5]
MFYKFGQIAHVHTPTAIRNQDARFDRVTPPASHRPLAMVSVWGASSDTLSTMIYCVSPGTSTAVSNSGSAAETECA